jgi:hypothetical protein
VLIAPICLSHDDIKDRPDDELLFHPKEEESGGSKESTRTTLRGIPIESDEFSPMLLLVPHTRAQSFNMAVSLSHVSNIIMSLLVCSYEEKQDM